MVRSGSGEVARWLGAPALGLVLALVAPPVPAALAAAAAGDDAAAAAQRGAEHFKDSRFFEAAVQFERAAQLDPADARNLRYAGRAWQELGHWRRALVLLEAYLRVERNPEHRASIAEKIEPLRRATPAQIAEALAAALVKYPQARLESEAARAWEEVGSDDALAKAGELWEVARVRAVSDAERAGAEAGIQRIAQRKLDARASRERHAAAQREAERQRQAQEKKPPAEDVKPHAAAAPEPRGPGTLRIALYTGGGVALVGGLTLAALGYLGAVDVNDRATQGAYKGLPYTKYSEDMQTQDNLAYAGWGLAALGASAVGWAWLSTPKPAATSAARWQVQPRADPGGAGLVLSGSF